MKKLKKIISLVLAAVMVLAFGMTVSAETITVDSDLQDHTFQAYKIFDGNQSKGSAVLVDIEWADGVDATAILGALKTDQKLKDLFGECSTAEDVAKVISNWTDGNANAIAFAKCLYTNKDNLATPETIISGTTKLSAGYYLLVDKTGKDDEAFNPAVLQVTGKGDLEIEKKTDWPSVVKKVKEDNDAGHQNTWNDAADYDIGDPVPFRLVGTVPDMSAYDNYVYTFTDSLSDGLDFNNDVEVYFVDNDSTTKENIAKHTDKGAGGTLVNEKDYTLELTKDGNRTIGFTLSFSNLKTVEGINGADYIVVEYTATLNSNAKVGNPGNPNEVTLTYSNNPNPGGTGLTDTTPKDEVVVFTFDINVEKVDGALESTDPKYYLSGAEFALFSNEGDANAAAADPSNLSKALKFTGSNGQYTKDDANGSATLTVDENGNVNIKGLDQGTYYLVETKAPTDYNRLTSPKAVVLTPTYNSSTYDNHEPDQENDILSSVSINNVSGGKVTVENYSGSTLPETGGIGTTIFYVVGGILVIGAAVLLITRRRMRK